MALEVGRLQRHGNPTCSECTDRLQRMRGCKKPGYDFPRQLGPVRITSPMFVGDAPLEECPVGYLLREAPHTYDVLDAVSLIGNASPNEYAALPLYAQRMGRVYAAEVNGRLPEIEAATRRSQADLEHGQRVLRGRG